MNLMARFNLEKAGFTLNHFRKLKICAESKSFSEAAQKLTKPEGLIHSISALEALLGLEVFEKKDTPVRTLRSTNLTPAGRKIYEAFRSLDKIIRTDLHPQITIYSLKALKFASESSTFRGASKKLNVLSTSLVNAISHLEKALGQTLFERTPRTQKTKGGAKTTQLTSEGGELLKAFCHFEEVIKNISNNKTI